ncbi:META domain-containing protein [Thalassococcus sp. S3]|uniref:META domain-containing protein n=1 Tax=Thalassococcus sp. S3 TaxID=2017482 RepID=UPI00102439DF|nr:META domain-containing protein [Thalassococcus sp. S3]QBF30019.1 META domain-containing protein [Thalassococcus sp. S3]
MTRALLLTLLIASCQPDETVRGHGAGDRIWVLQELNGAPFTPRATLQFPERGRMTGDAPCNRYSTGMTMPYPWFEVGPIAATKRGCPDLDAEVAFFDALRSMTLVEVVNQTMILTNETGGEMLFTTSE